MGWMITLAIVTALAVLPLGVGIRYDENGPLVRLIAGPVKITLFPRPKKAKQKETKAAQDKKDAASQQELPKPPQPPKEKKSASQEKKGGSLTDFIPFVKLGLNFLGDFRRKLRLNNLQLKLILAGGDPCDLAVNYGKAWAAVSNLIPRLDSWFVIKKRDIEVECDFVASETLVYAHLDLTITLGRLLSLATVYGVRALKEFLNFKNKRKGGAVT